MPVDERWLALCFGHVASNLRDDCYEYDLGLRTTLNCVDPKKLKNTDTAEPGTARRRRTQLAVGSDLTLFDFDRDSAVLRSLTGKVKDEFSGIIGQATGATNIRVKSKAAASDLEKLGRGLIEIYQLEDYRTTFADIQNVVPVRDPVVLDRLSLRLLENFENKSENLVLGIPELVDYADGLHASFTGLGTSKIYDDVVIDAYFEYLEDHGVDLASMTVATLKRHRLNVLDENDSESHSYSIFRALISDVELPSEPGVAYHLSEGHWYRVDKAYLEVLTAYLDPKFEDLNLPDCNVRTEGEYNEILAKSDDLMICLDKTNISPKGQKQLEPCDVYSLRDGNARLIHVKISTDAPAMSHLFNQGSNAVELLRSEPEARDNLSALILAKANSPDVTDELLAPVPDSKFEVAYAIITPKDKSGRSGNLPLFSRISLRRNLKSLEVMGTPAVFGYIDDSYGRSIGRKKPRKPRATKD
jgi:uncharacterized protein (TIGR04141 family)